MSIFKTRNQRQENLNTSRHTILLVDDEEHILVELKSLLKDEYNIITATDGNEALQKLKGINPSEMPCLIICDQRMPVMTGVEFFETIIKGNIAPEAFRIILTGYVDIPIMIDAINKAQIYQYILKPFEPVDLLLAIRRAINHHVDLVWYKRQNEKLMKENQELRDRLDELEGGEKD